MALPCGGILLAAGASTRFGRPKQILDYHGEAFVRAAARSALTSGLKQVIVVTGAHAAPVRAALDGLPVRIAHNPLWQAGQSTSLQCGLRALESGVRAAVVLLADQPQVTPTVIQALCETYQRTHAPIIAPLIDGSRANPVLLAAETFPLLMEIHGDVGARAIFQHYAPRYLPWLDERLRYDVDSPEDYQKLIAQTP